MGHPLDSTNGGSWSDILRNARKWLQWILSEGKKPFLCKKYLHETTDNLFVPVCTELLQPESVSSMKMSGEPFM